MQLNIEDIFQRLDYLDYNPTIHSRGNNDIIEFYRNGSKFTINCRKYLIRIMTSVSEFELLTKYGPNIHKYISSIIFDVMKNVIAIKVYVDPDGYIVYSMEQFVSDIERFNKMLPQYLSIFDTAMEDFYTRLEQIE